MDVPAQTDEGLSEVAPAQRATSPRVNKVSQQPTEKLPADQAKLLTSIQTLNDSIISTEEQLSRTLREICQLNSAAPEPKPDSNQPFPLNPEERVTLQQAQEIFAQRISLLKAYNEIKDVAMGLLSIIAEKEGRRLVEIMEERGVPQKD